MKKGLLFSFGLLFIILISANPPSGDEKHPEGEGVSTREAVSIQNPSWDDVLRAVRIVSRTNASRGRSRSYGSRRHRPGFEGRILFSPRREERRRENRVPVRRLMRAQLQGGNLEIEDVSREHDSEPVPRSSVSASTTFPRHIFFDAVDGEINDAAPVSSELSRQ